MMRAPSILLELRFNASHTPNRTGAALLYQVAHLSQMRRYLMTFKTRGAK